MATAAAAMVVVVVEEVAWRQRQEVSVGKGERSTRHECGGHVVSVGSGEGKGSQRSLWGCGGHRLRMGVGVRGTVVILSPS